MSSSYLRVKGRASQFVVDTAVAMEGDVVPVGYPVPDMEVLIVDDSLNPVGAGEVGQIAVRSRYLSNGYWRKPELTASRFVPDPGGGGARIHLTGDLGRMRPDGCLLHLGRTDFQLKARGYSVNAHEVEKALVAVPGVKGAVATARDDFLGESRLVAYVAGDADVRPTVSELRNRLAETLPDYMVPSIFTIMEALPMTAGGKVDRRALPAPDGLRPKLDAPFVPPRDDVEAAVAGVWTDMLGLERVGVNDNFIELGGDSLLAARVVARMREILGTDLPLSRFFETPTVADMARAIVADEPVRGRAETVGRLMREVDAMSAEEVRAALAKRMGGKDAS